MRQAFVWQPNLTPARWAAIVFRLSTPSGKATKNVRREIIGSVPVLSVNRYSALPVN
jgi:hypothetical protein